MSSSMFIEPSSVQLPKDEDANLVVVYGKKTGVNIDPEELEKLIEKKTVQSISVIRLTSPTPSMEDAEEAERLEAVKNAQDSAADTDEQSDAEANERKRDDANAEGSEKSETETEDDESEMSDEEHSRDEDSSSDHEASLVKKRKMKRGQRKLKDKNQSESATKAKPRAELVGLTFEGFYEAEAALEIAKEACKMAGISYIRNTAEHEAMLLVIRNDHCYTPFTSPEQMKAKILSDKLEAEKMAANARKVQPQLTVQAKQVMLMKARKPQMAASPPQAAKPSLKKPSDMKTQRVVLEKPQQDQEVNSSFNSADDFDEDEETYELIDVDSDYSASEQSDESENDRDSDLDFDVNNRQLKKRKAPLGQKKARKLPVSKQALEKRADERPMPSNSALTAQRTAVAAKLRVPASNINMTQARQVRTLPTIGVQMTPKSPAAAGSPAGMQNVVVNKLFTRPAITITPKLQRPVQVTQITAPASPSASPTSAESFKRVVNLPKGDTTLQSPKQNVKEIVLNKVMSSPKGGFTELSTLISAEETSQKQQETHAKPSNSNMPSIISNVVVVPAGGGSTPTTSRGFTRIDAASKNQLPAQISLETHHSSNELAAEHDKQLDLIDSIVKDELNKSLEEEIIEKPSIGGINENIPKLVEMLESTEKALVSSNNSTATTTNPASSLNIQAASNINTPSAVAATASHVDDLDIAHGLPEELLQHVVELIEDDKTLKEAVEKQILEDQSFRNDTAGVDNQMSVLQQQQKASNSAAAAPVVSDTSFTTLPPTVQIIQPLALAGSIAQPTTSTAKSIIQMSISNISSPTASIQLSASPLNYTPKSSQLTRRDPIQIVRGNGRVITLPPIEAPTTRAKRRAQVAPSTPGQTPNFADLNESSLDSSMHSNASFSAVSAAPAMSTSMINETFGSATVEKKQQQQRRASKEEKNLKKASATKAKKAALAAILQQEDAEASYESQGDDDDPNKLWCICRQPHNNRFMICCDACGDWFHGKCVNITKAMGREMELKGKEWTCPLCKKKQEEKQQRKLTDMLPLKRSDSQSSTGEKPKQQNVVKTLITNVASMTPTTLSTTSTTTKEFNDSKLIAVSKDAASVSKKSASSPFVIVKTPASSTKKAPLNLSDVQKKLQANKQVAGQGKIKLLTTTPVRSAAAANVQVKTPQSSRAEGGSVSHRTPPTATPTTTTKVVNIPTVPCVFCKKAARPPTVYCSDECIRRCAQNAINVITAKTAEQNATTSSGAALNLLDDKKKKQKGLFEDLLAMPDRKPKIERITVYERKTGTKLSGSNAPTTVTIRKWLHENPTFEIVLPGGQLSHEIEHKLQQQQQQQQRGLTPQKATEGAATARAHVSGGIDKMTPLKLTKTSPITVTTGQISQKIHSPQTLKAHKTAAGADELKPRTVTTPRQPQKQQQQTHAKTTTREEPKSKERQHQQLKRQSSESSTGGGGSSSKRRSAETASTSSSSTTAATTTDSEPIRMNVRRTLKNEILQRMRESTTVDEAKLTSEEVEAFIKQTESEMYHYFNRDTGQKYRNKYRSLMFNIKDRKNRTLFAKICAKQIEPKQLVHMSGAELASQELAKWREEENKHQLEMIKKSELEMLSCTKNYLFKNHKGEEVIESKETDVCVNLDITTPVEDLVNVLNSSTAGLSSFENEANESAISAFDAMSPGKLLTSPIVSGSVGDEMSPQHAEHPHQQQQQHHHHHHHHHHEERPKSRRDSEKEHRSKSREHDRHKDDNDKDRERRERRHRSRSRERERDRDKRHHRDKSRSRRRSKSRSRSRSRSQERRHKSTKDERRDRDRDGERERDEKDRKKTGADHKVSTSSTTATSKTPTSVITQIQHKDKQRDSPTIVTKPKLQKQPTLECFNLIDQIIESSKTVEEAANLVKDSNKEKPKEKPKVDFTVPTSSSSAQETVIAPPKRVLSTSDSDQEPTSTVSIPTPPREEPSFSRTNSPTDFGTQTLWSGIISMNEVATLQMNIQPLIGNSSNVGNVLPQALDVVGRIDIDTVWEYISKIRKSPNKEIVLIRLTPLSDDDIDGYAKLFSYLDQKKRLGVVKSSTPYIKDFYIFPLGSGKPMPKVLQITGEHSFYNDPYRADVIVGILVCKRGIAHATSSTARVSSSAHFSSSSSAAKHSRHRHRLDTTESFTPPGSPKRKKRTHKTDIDLDAIVKTPIVRKPAAAATSATIDDADEPYSPGGSSDDDLVSMYTAKAPPTVLLGLASADEELKRKMEEINRQIAAQEIEIAGLLNAENTGASASVLANISIPSNLPQILASINKGKETPSSSGAAARVRTDASEGSRMPAATAFEEYNPEEAMSTTKISTSYAVNAPKPTTSTSSTSRLAQLSEAELLSMVPDDVLLESSSNSQPPPYYNEPPPPGV